MGTNYYLHENVCPHCGRSDERLHIGKSSYGWVFALHVMPDSGIHGLPDWIDRWLKPGTLIRDEYGTEIKPEGMLKKITERSHEPRENIPSGYDSWKHF